jgi:hypothetical protein
MGLVPEAPDPAAPRRARMMRQFCCEIFRSNHPDIFELPRIRGIDIFGK